MLSGHVVISCTADDAVAAATADDAVMNRTNYKDKDKKKGQLFKLTRNEGELFPCVFRVGCRPFGSFRFLLL